MSRTTDGRRLQAALPKEHVRRRRRTWRVERDAVLFARVVLRRPARRPRPRPAPTGWPCSTWSASPSCHQRRATASCTRRTTSAGTAARRSCPTDPGDAPAPVTRRALRCPYHSWTYDLDGRLLKAPHTEDVDDFDAERVRAAPGRRRHLGRLRLRAPDAGPRAPTSTDAMARRSASGSRATRSRAGRRPHASPTTSRANYKVLAENYNECYHCGPVHPELTRLVPAVRRRRRRASTGRTASRTARARGRSR